MYEANARALDASDAHASFGWTPTHDAFVRYHLPCTVGEVTHSCQHFNAYSDKRGMDRPLHRLLLRAPRASSSTNRCCSSFFGSCSSNANTQLLLLGFCSSGSCSVGTHCSCVIISAAAAARIAMDWHFNSFGFFL